MYESKCLGKNPVSEIDLQGTLYSANGLFMKAELEKSFPLVEGYSSGRILFESDETNKNAKSFFLKLEVTAQKPYLRTFNSILVGIHDPSFLKKDPKFVSGLLKNVCRYAIRPEDVKTKDGKATVLSIAGHNAIVLLSAFKKGTKLSESSVERLAFWITRKKNSPMEFFSENKIFTKIEFGDSKIVGVVPSFFSAAELSAFIFACDRLPTVSEANQFYLKQQESIGKERV